MSFGGTMNRTSNLTAGNHRWIDRAVRSRRLRSMRCQRGEANANSVDIDDLQITSTTMMIDGFSAQLTADPEESGFVGYRPPRQDGRICRPLGAWYATTAVMLCSCTLDTSNDGLTGEAIHLPSRSPCECPCAHARSHGHS